MKCPMLCQCTRTSIGDFVELSQLQAGHRLSLVIFGEWCGFCTPKLVEIKAASSNKDLLVMASFDFDFESM